MDLEETGGYRICSRCHNSRPAEQFLGGKNGSRCIRCRMHDTAEKARYRRRQALKAGKPREMPKPTKPTREKADGLTPTEANPNVTLAVRLKTILRKAMKPEELADRLCNLARSADERIASASLETLMALQGVVVPKKVEESSDQRFFVMSAALTPKVDVEIDFQNPMSDNLPTATLEPTKAALKLA